MLYLLFLLLFMCGFFVGCFCFLFIFVWYVREKFENYLDGFERRVDFTFEHYFKVPLFPKKD